MALQSVTAQDKFDMFITTSNSFKTPITINISKEFYLQ